MNRDNDKGKVLIRRSLIMALGKFFLLLVIVGRLYYLQVYQADRYKTLADENRISTRLLIPPRGEIVDRNGKILNIGVVNRFNDSVNLIKKYIDDGRLGEVYHVYVSFRAHRSIPGLGGAFTTKAIAGGGALIDWGVHYLDIVMYCTGDPTPKTVTGEAFCKLGKDMPNYVYKNMWSENTKDLNGTYDVDDSVTALIRTEGPTFTLHGAWAQNIDHDEMYIDFMGDKGGIRLKYGANFEVFTTMYGSLVKYEPEFKMNNHFQNEIDAFVRSVQTGERLPSHIDTVAVTARIMQAIYDSAAQHREIVLD